MQQAVEEIQREMPASWQDAFEAVHETWRPAALAAAWRAYDRAKTADGRAATGIYYEPELRAGAGLAVLRRVSGVAARVQQTYARQTFLVTSLRDLLEHGETPLIDVPAGVGLQAGRQTLLIPGWPSGQGIDILDALDRLTPPLSGDALKALDGAGRPRPRGGA